MNPDLSSTADILRAFFDTETVSLTSKMAASRGRVLVTDILGAPAKNVDAEAATLRLRPKLTAMAKCALNRASR